MSHYRKPPPYLFGVDPNDQPMKKQFHALLLAALITLHVLLHGRPRLRAIGGRVLLAMLLLACAGLVAWLAW